MAEPVRGLTVDDSAVDQQVPEENLSAGPGVVLWLQSLTREMQSRGTPSMSPALRRTLLLCVRASILDGPRKIL